MSYPHGTGQVPQTPATATLTANSDLWAHLERWMLEHSEQYTVDWCQACVPNSSVRIPGLYHVVVKLPGRSEHGFFSRESIPVQDASVSPLQVPAARALLHGLVVAIFYSGLLPFPPLPSST